MRAERVGARLFDSVRSTDCKDMEGAAGARHLFPETGAAAAGSFHGQCPDTRVGVKAPTGSCDGQISHWVPRL